jgi:hypothetical protein
MVSTFVAMKKVILQFGTITGMLDFETEVPTHGHIKDHSRLTIAGYFEESQIELAKAAFNATVIEDDVT